MFIEVHLLSILFTESSILINFHARFTFIHVHLVSFTRDILFSHVFILFRIHF